MSNIISVCHRKYAEFSKSVADFFIKYISGAKIANELLCVTFDGCVKIYNCNVKCLYNERFFLNNLIDRKSIVFIGIFSKYRINSVIANRVLMLIL